MHYIEEISGSGMHFRAINNILHTYILASVCWDAYSCKLFNKKYLVYVFKDIKELELEKSSIGTQNLSSLNLFNINLL